MKKITLILTLIFGLLLPHSTPVMAEMAPSTSSVQKKGDQGLIVSSILLIATVLAAYTFIQECTGQPSGILFSATSLMFIASEIKNWNNYKKLSDQEYKIYEDKDIDEQIAAFTAAEEETRKAANSANQHAKANKNAGTGFLIAGVVALIEGICDVITFCTWDSKCSGSVTPPSQKSTPYTALSELLIPSAHAGSNDGRLMGLGIGAIAAVVEAKTLQETFLDIAKEHGIARAVVFAAFSAIAFTSASQIQKAADMLTERADAYAKLRNKLLQIQTNRLRIGTGKGETAISVVPMKTKKLELKEPSNCFTGGKYQGNPDPKCSCRKNNSCKKMEIPKVDFNGMNISPLLSSSLNTLGTAGDGLYSGNSGAFTLATDNLNGKSIGLRKLLKDRVAQANQLRKKQGKKPYDFDKNVSNMIKKIKNGANATYAGLSKAQKASLLDQVGFGRGGGRTIIKRVKKALKKPKVYGATSLKAKKKTKEDPFSGMDFSDDELKNVEEIDFADRAKDYELNSNDIEKEKNKDIFKIIHQRYLKTAYPILLEEI